MKTLREQMLAAGMQPDQLDNWCSDLYVLKNDISSKVLESYEWKKNVTTFKAKVEPYKGRMWYDIPFGYAEYFEDKTGVIPEERREFVRQYAVKFTIDTKDTSDLSDDHFEQIFRDCALPLRPVFYPMLREEIQKVLEEEYNLLNGYQLIIIKEFFKYNSGFLGDREQSIICGINSYIDYEMSKDYPGCYTVVNPDNDGDNTCVIAWDRQGYKRGTVVN